MGARDAELAKRVKAGEFDVATEEAALIKTRSAFMHTTTVYARLVEAVEGEKE